MSRGLPQRNSVLTSTSRRSCPRRRTPKVEQLQSGRKIRRDGRRRRQRRTGAHESRRRYIGSGTDVAIESGDIILVDNNPLDVVRLIRLSKASYRKMQENLVWATGYNVFALPLAAGILAPIGILLSPAIGAVFMSLSTIIVAINARRLGNVDLSVPA